MIEKKIYTNSDKPVHCKYSLRYHIPGQCRDNADHLYWEKHRLHLLVEIMLRMVPKIIIS